MTVDDSKQESVSRAKLARLHRLIQTVCGIYSRVASRLRLNRSYVSRVARGERRSEQVERALISEFERIEGRQQRSQ